MEALDMILKYIVLPVGGLVWILFNRQQAGFPTDITWLTKAE